MFIELVFGQTREVSQTQPFEKYYAQKPFLVIYKVSISDLFLNFKP